MKPEDLEYPWRKDFEEIINGYENRINQLEQRNSSLENTVNNLRNFCQKLHDRLNLGGCNYDSSPVDKPY